MALVLKLHITLSAEGSSFLAYGGAPGGRDSLHNTVSKWPGWRRLRSRGVIPDLPGSESVGAACSMFSAPISPVTAMELNAYTGPVAWTPQAKRAVEAHIHNLKRFYNALELAPPRWLREPRTPNGRKPRTHQAQALEALRHVDRQRIWICDEMGLGKTSTAIWGSWTKRTLVLCTASTKFNWRREIWESVNNAWVTLVNGTPKQRAAQFSDVLYALENGAPWPEPHIVVINYDLLRTLSTEHLELLARWVDDQTLICDESHYLKNIKTKRWKITKEYFAPSEGGARQRYMLTGTPVFNTVADEFAQVELMRPGTWTSYWDFVKRYIDTRRVTFGTGPQARTINKTVGAKNLKELNAITATMKIRRLKAVLKDLPPMTRTYPELELEGPFLTMYKAMKDWAVIAIEELGVDTSSNVFTPQAKGAANVILRCEQMALGFTGGVPTVVMEQISSQVGRLAEKIPGRPHEMVFPNSPKMAWLTEAIDCVVKQGGKPVVFSRFNGPLIWLRHHYEANSVMMHGGQSAELKDHVVNEFQHGRADIFLCQVTMAEGFNLTASQDVLFLSRSHVPAHNNQAESRAHRDGQTGTVNIQVPIVLNTVEKLYHKKLAQKQGDADEALAEITIQDLLEAL